MRQICGIDAHLKFILLLLFYLLRCIVPALPSRGPGRV
jgi:hypothetical protein